MNESQTRQWRQMEAQRQSFCVADKPNDKQSSNGYAKTLASGSATSQTTDNALMVNGHGKDAKRAVIKA
jgi:hypothetical protein